jgi:hypothetical protein
MTNFYQFHEFREMNNPQIICGKMSSQFNNWIIIFRFAMIWEPLFQFKD